MSDDMAIFKVVEAYGLFELDSFCVLGCPGCVSAARKAVKFFIEDETALTLTHAKGKALMFCV